MITELKQWAKDKPVEIQGAVRNVVGTLKLLRKNPNDVVAQDQLAKNVAALDVLKRTMLAEQ